MTQVLVLNCIKLHFVLQIRIANLLGVAGTDVPVKEIEKMSPHYKVGGLGHCPGTTEFPDLVYSSV